MTIHKYEWDDAAVVELERLCERGYSASEIARVFDVTRNSIIGKTRRLGLTLRGRRKDVGKMKPPKPIKRTVKKRKKGFDLSGLRDLPPAQENAPPSRSLTMMDLEPKDCR